jgi:branched-chain amino acid transport system ATP-binding protein
MLFAGLEEVFFRVPSIGNYLTLVSAVLLAAVLLLYPGGLAALGRTVGARSRHLWARYREMRRRLVSDDLAGVGSTGPEGDGTPAEAVEAVEAVVPQPDARPPGEGAAGRPSLLAPLRNRLAPVLGGVRSSFDRWLMLRQARRQIESSSATLDFGRLLAPDLEPSMPEPAELEVEEPPDASTNGHHAPGATASWETEAIAPVELPPRPRRRPLIEVAGVTVRFGGLTAVSGFSMSVREGEIVGLIGPNGAGKTTSFNSIAGFNTPAEGRVQLHGADVTPLPVYLRSRLGVARTFQVIQLFPQLDVFDNLLVATYIADRGSFFSDMFMLNRALSEELKARRRVEDVIRLLDLADVAHRGVSELPFGVLRMVEIARALVTGAPVIMLDEPASGLDDLETERLTQLVRYLRSLGVTILLIEHDVKMVTSVSDYMYVLDQGTPIAEGTPDEIQRNPAVIAAYLGEETEETEETESQPASVRS